jgi:hypothetical protein
MVVIYCKRALKLQHQENRFLIKLRTQELIMTQELIILVGMELTNEFCLFMWGQW